MTSEFRPIATAFIYPVLEHLLRQGLSINEALALTGLPDCNGDINSLPSVMPIERVVTGMEKAIQWSGDECFHINSALNDSIVDYTPLPMIVSLCKNTFQSLSLYNQYINVFNQAIQTNLTIGEHETALLSYPRDRAVEYCRYVEYRTAAIVRQLSKLTSFSMEPFILGIEFAHSPLGNKTTEAFLPFCEDVKFNCKDSKVILDSKMLNFELPSHDANLLKTLIEKIENHRRTIGIDAEEFSVSCRSAIRNCFGKSKPTLSAISERLKISESTIKRKLSEQGLTFQKILDLERFNELVYIARYVPMTPQKASEILGYGSLPSFYQAVKRLTGLTWVQLLNRISSDEIDTFIFKIE